MPTLKIFRETSLPGSLEANSIYLIAPTSTPDFVEIYVTGNSANTVKRVVTKADVLQWINDAISGLGVQEVYVVDNITARNNLSLSGPAIAYVIDATGDSTVSSGGATYIWNPNTETWIKVSEWESLDIVLSWANISGKPTSSPSEIDDAVAKKHTHTNMTQLNKIGEDSNGLLTYNGQYPKIAWDSANW